jgi:hypothetical protein
MCQIKAPIAVNSKAIAKIGNAELAHFNQQMLIHELIRGSLVNQPESAASSEAFSPAILRLSSLFVDITLPVSLVRQVLAQLNATRDRDGLFG